MKIIISLSFDKHWPFILLSFPELLPDVDNFLRHILKKETLSSLAEKKRKYYVERLDVFILPPNLPARPEGRSIHH